MFKKLKQALFPTRYRLKRMDRELEELRKLVGRSVALQQKASIENSPRFRANLAALSGEGPAADAEISPALQFAADDLRPEIRPNGTAGTVICTIALGEAYRVATGPCLESQRAYARRWNLDYAELGAPPSRLLRHPSWYKIPLVYGLARHYRRIAFFDADVLVTRPDFPLDSLFERLAASRRDLHLSNDESGLNMGVFFAEANPTLAFLLDVIWNYPFDPDHITWEQIAVRTLADEYPAIQNRLLVTGQPRDFNSFPEERARIHKLHHQANTWQPGDFLCHFSGIAAAQLPEMVARYQALAGAAK
jgi:hypothetical protein